MVAGHFVPVSMNSENKREQQNKRKQTSTQPKQHVICNWQTFMRHIVIVAHCGDVILCFSFTFSRNICLIVAKTNKATVIHLADSYPR